MRVNVQPPVGASVARLAGIHLLAFVLLGMTCLTGCGGCSQKTAAQKAAEKKAEDEKAAEEAKKKAEEEKKNKPFVIERLTPMLSQSLISTDKNNSLQLAKPGHWTTTVQPMKANLEDFDGRITLTVVDSKGRPQALPHTRYDMVSSRPAVLAKGRPKRVENEILISTDSNKVNIRCELSDRLSGSAVTPPQTESWLLMPAHQYFILVLAKEPGRYAFLKLTESINAPNEEDGAAGPPHYRVVFADGNKALPLPGNVLTWTSIAYIFWDEVNLDRLDPQQQQALVDWIHWGGRLIINGPDSLDSLRASFLANCLPADPGERIAFDQKAVEKFNQYWGMRDKGKTLKSLAVTKDWSGVKLKPRSAAKPLRSAEGLFYEMPVGAGSVVVSAIQLTERDLLNWPGFDGFLNGALLRRPPRQFRVEDLAGAYTGLQTLWAGHDDHSRDAYYTTPVRWFARDAGTKANAISRMVNVDPATGMTGNSPYGIEERQTVVDRPGGLGEWSETSPVSKVARDSLREAAGVRVPAASFVVMCLAVYLIVLVPLNWMVFHALGRVEWAWISAPIIAVIGTLAVVHQAQLDIGFVRSQTEIALLELQGDHPRGHLSRYTALYASLSSTYDMEFGDVSAVATPFPHDENWNPRYGDSISTVSFEKYDKARLRGVEISSATTQMVHSEQMVSLDGPIRMYASTTTPNLKQIDNKSAYNLADAVIVRRRFDGSGKEQIAGCWIGDIPSGQSRLLSAMSPLAWKEGTLPFQTERQEAAKLWYKKRLNVDPLLEMAFKFPAAGEDPIHGRQEETRLVARIDEMLPGAVTSPGASQTAGATVVLAHLEESLPPMAMRDVNSPSDVMTDQQRNAYMESLDASEPTPDDE
jgi:hypothetical protein